VLAGGSGRRLGFVDKPSLVIGGETLLTVALRAVAPALTVVVGPPRDLPQGVLQVREDPAGGGPAAAIAAGVALLQRTTPEPDRAELVAVLAADLPGMNSTALGRLATALRRTGRAGAVLVDAAGQDQYLAGVWRTAALGAAVRSRSSWEGAPVSQLLVPLVGVRLPADRSTTADIDTTADLLQWTAKTAPTEPGDTRPDR
jgi:molybdopterin-guanine dinucleotide biosynthesis protein A